MSIYFSVKEISDCPWYSQTGLWSLKGPAWDQFWKDLGLGESDKAVTLLRGVLSHRKDASRREPSRTKAVCKHRQPTNGYWSQDKRLCQNTSHTALSPLFNETAEKGNSVLISVLVQAPHCIVDQQRALNLSILKRVFFSQKMHWIQTQHEKYYYTYCFLSTCVLKTLISKKEVFNKRSCTSTEKPWFRNILSYPRTSSQN